jgi:HTH-type transcriptional regulator/antitoxin HigA
MELKPIKTKAEYKSALREIEALFDVPEHTPQADKLEVLAMLVEKYEAEHYPIPAPDPIDFLGYIMEARGLSRKDMEPYIGSRGRVAEVMNRIRPLSLTMIRNLSEGLKLPADVLIMEYELCEAA